MSLGGVATSALFASILLATDGPRMANISLGLLLDRLCGGSTYTTSKRLSNASVVATIANKSIYMTAGRRYR